jgi:DHA1 family bicyclomycin/chloramphenicol resistance-like MFS transporter
MVFMAVPIIAPAFGQLVLMVGSWRLIFAVIAAAALAVCVWFMVRMPETLAVEDRVPLVPRRLLANWRHVLTDRLSLGYALAAMVLQGSLFGYLNSIQPIMERVFARPELLAIVFAGSAGMMAVANLLNSRIVMRVGTRRISQAATVTLILASIINLAVAGAGLETLWTFAVLQAVTMASFGLATSNFSAMAMQNMGAIAGTASSVQGFLGVTGGTLIGALIGRAFDGTATPLHVGFLIAGLLAFGIVAIVERGRLFQPAS